MTTRPRPNHSLALYDPECNQYGTVDNGKYQMTALVLGASRAITFSVVAKHDARVGFFSSKKINSAVYEVVISGLKNTQSVIHHQGTDRVTQATAGLLDATTKKYFWADAANGLVRLGTGSTVGQNVLMQWQDPNPYVVDHVGLMSGLSQACQTDVGSCSSSGKWEICAPTSLEPPVGEWFHIVATWQQSGEACMYMNGEEVECTTAKQPTQARRDLGNGRVELNPAEERRFYSSVYPSLAIRPLAFRRSMLDSPTGWSAATNNIGEWIVLDLGATQSVAGVVTQAPDTRTYSTLKSYVKTFNVQYSIYRSWTWRSVPGLFAASADHTRVTALFRSPFRARFVKLVVQSWHNHISLRAGVVVEGVPTPTLNERLPLVYN